MRARYLAASLLALFLLHAAALAGKSDFAITYRSSEHVYIDGGESEGITVGSRLFRVPRTGDSLFIEVVHASLHSASCRPVSTDAVPEVGQKFILLESISKAQPTGARDEKTAAVATTSAATAVPAAYKRARVLARMSGSISFSMHHWADGGTPGLDYTQSTARQNLRARRLFNENLTFVIRSRGRYDDRAPSYRSVTGSEWDRRIWELSLTYDGADRPLYLSAGRILVRGLPTAGYLDGGLAELRLNSSVRAGAFAGRRPDWLYREDTPAMSAYGGYLTVERKGKGSFVWQQTAGFMAEYNTGEVNRSVLLLTGNMRRGSTWGLYHTLEADLNTGWRKEAAGQSLSLSRAFASLNFRPARWVRFTASYDNLKPYWTYAYRSTADSLFDDRVRQGFRLMSQLSVGKHMSFSFGSGYRSQSGGVDPTITYLANIRRTAFVERWLSLYLSFAGFDGPYEHGLTYHLQGDYARPGWPRLRAGYGHYGYSVVGVAGSRMSSSFDLGADFDLWRTVYAGLWAEHNSGDDIKGWRLQAEIGYRL